MHSEMCIIYFIYILKCLGLYAYEISNQVFCLKNILDPSL